MAKEESKGKNKQEKEINQSQAWSENHIQANTTTLTNEEYSFLKELMNKNQGKLFFFLNSFIEKKRINIIV